MGGSAKSLKALAKLLDSISENPFDISLHVQHIRLAQSLKDTDGEVQSAMEMFTSFYAAGEDIWLELIRIKRNEVDLGTEEGVNELMMMYERAENDYLSIPLLKNHAEFLLEQYEKYASEEQDKPAALGELFSAEWMRPALAEVTKKSTSHTVQSYKVWDLRRDWELEQLDDAQPGPVKAVLISSVSAMLEERLKEPHSNSDDTLQAYSSLTTHHKPASEYEEILSNANKLRSQAVKFMSRRDQMENKLTISKYSLDAYAAYLSWESRSKYPDLFAMTGLHERAIAEAAKRRFDGQADAETYLRTFWISYCDIVRHLTEGTDVLIQVLKKAVRSVPGSGEIWARYIRALEASATPDNADDIASAVAELYETAMAASFTKSPEVEQFIPLILARAGFEKRRFEAGDGDDEAFATLIVVLEGGIALVRKDPAGEQWFRLEKYLSEIYRSAGITDSVVGVWEATSKHYKNSYSAFTMYTDALLKGDRTEEARKAFQEMHRKQFDWPEGVWDAWIALEHMYGTVADINSAIDQIEKARLQLNARRAKEADKAQYQYSQMEAERSTTFPMSEPPVHVVHADAMVIDQPVPMKSERGTKRPADNTEAEIVAKRQKTSEEAISLKRDRENCTVFVADMPTDVVEDDLRALFKDCGSIREVKISSFQNGLVATIEFMERDSVAQALTRDKKRIHDQEIAVHLAWSSTLYVTNFPEQADDKYIRDMFYKFGTIFDVRWPSKKFKDSRRFCYVQYTSPTSAQAALELHGEALGSGRSLSVQISNPERRKGRTDEDADQREIYVAGLPRSTTNKDLQKLFKEYGVVKDVRLGTDKDGRCKGFAFVEFETPECANAALKANNTEFKTRRLAITISDPRAKRPRNAPDTGFGQRADARNRSVRVKNLPANTETQEGLLQQVLEKVANVKRVEIISDTREALVELANAAEAGKLLLTTEPLIFGGNTLQFVEETALPGTLSSAPRESKAPFVPRSASSRPRGVKKRVALGAPVNSAASQLTTSNQASGPSNPTTPKGQNHFRSMLGN